MVRNRSDLVLPFVITKQIDVNQSAFVINKKS